MAKWSNHEEQDAVTQKEREAAWAAMRKGIELVDPESDWWYVFECPECKMRLALSVGCREIIAERHLEALENN